MLRLKHISLPHLAAEAHGDPWAINYSLQSGCPAAISGLAVAFHKAAQSSTEAGAAFDAALRRFEASWNRQNGDHPINDSAEVQRAIQSLHVQTTQLPRIAIDLENIAAALAEAQKAATERITTLAGELYAVDDLIGKALANEHDVNLTAQDRSLLDLIIAALETIAIDDTKEALGELESIRRGYSDKLQTSLTALRTDGYDPETIRAWDAPGIPTKAEPEANRRQNQIDAFAKVFGRPPTSAADWETAAALDSHSYDPKNGGVPPNLVVQRIKPVPGQGVVRTNLFIPGHGVVNPQLDWPPAHENLGDNRGFSATADPESSRVSITVDYENGIIVARQNPSVDAKTGRIQTGIPTVSATQRSNGTVVVKYSAADPMSPGGETLAKLTTFDVNGTIAIEPSAAGPRVGGNVTNFPAIEIYSDRGGNTTPLVQSWPKLVDGAWGPEAGLWWHKPIGDPSVLAHAGAERPTLNLPGIPIPIPAPIGLPPLPIPIRIPLP